MIYGYYYISIKKVLILGSIFAFGISLIHIKTNNLTVVYILNAIKEKINTRLTILLNDNAERGFVFVLYF